MKIHGDVNVQSLFHSFRHGFRSLSHNAHRVTSSGFQISIASSILSVAGLILAFRDERGRRGFNNLFLSWSSSSESESSPEKSWVVPGLQNLGNNCFLNVVLQALASCSSFLSSLQKIVEDFEASSEIEVNEDMPLAVSLNALLQELCIIRHKGKVLSPRKVMLAMALYTPNFNLTSQQDAEEALAHMLSSLREECSVCFGSNHNSLTIATASSNRILPPNGRIIHSDLERWTQSFLGPFNGIIGSILTCQSCSFQISLDFQFFNCLYLSPPTYGGGSIIPGCSIEDCMKQFFVAERLENYFCTHCWHTSAMKYLSLLNKNETDIEKLQNCSKQDTCGCRNIQSLKSLPWSNNYSRTFKQLHIARSPKILCLNLQRASINAFGESVKLQGHISFPLSLNMSPFQNRGVEIKHMEQNQQPIRYSHIFKLQNDSYPLCNVYKQGKEGNLTERYTDYVETKQPCSEVDSELEIQEEQSHETLKLTPNGDHTYNLVSVVEHFGSTGGGHYTVYRRVSKKKTNDNNNTEIDVISEPCDVYWVGVSDSHVCRVSEEDVLGSRASLLFYERVLES
ncbi:unnamed protein product [Lactuca virosa]|uniref:Ubiquitin carboxyl-terminal hydrolase n=1 Tax=Lactuca virosa TaxID=75947 RepID=A0AAU9NG38_9ASTR|nr:unnamed protein product [Lactuca virosa]